MDTSTTKASDNETERKTARISTMAIRTQWPDKLRNVYQRSRWDLEFKKKGKKKKNVRRIRLFFAIVSLRKRILSTIFEKGTTLYYRVILECFFLFFFLLRNRMQSILLHRIVIFAYVKKKKKEKTIGDNSAFSLQTLNKFRDIAFQKKKKKEKENKKVKWYTLIHCVYT